jgi:glycerate dehydrogenase
VTAKRELVFDSLDCLSRPNSRIPPVHSHRRRFQDILDVLFDIVRALVKSCSFLVRDRGIDRKYLRGECTMKIVALDGRPLFADRDAWAGLDRFGQVEVYQYSSADEIRARAQGAGILITNKAPIGAALIDDCPELRFVTLTATGFDCVDIAAARRRGIPVSNVPVYGTRSVAQFVFALLLELCHHVNLHDQAVRGGEWTNQPDFSLRKTPLHELAGKTMGVVGLGRIGEHSAELAHAFGMEVLAHDAFRRPLASGRQVEWCELDELFARSDVITLHCPLTPETAGLVNRERMKRMKPTAFLINTARGGLVVDQDLAGALDEGLLAGAALDVVSVEPIRPENPLLRAKNCVITPHIAWATAEARGRLMEATVANVAAFLDGRPINVVN